MLLLAVYILLALVLSFLCSIAEAVLLSVTPAYIGSLERDGKRAAPLLRQQKADIERPLAAILTLNTTAHTVGAAGAGAQAAAVFGSAYVGVASALLTLAILIVSEIIPKTLGAVYWRQLAPATARGVQLLITALYPFVVISQAITKMIARDRKLPAISREEISAMADEGVREGQLARRESRIVKNLFRLRSLKVEDIMTPRTVVFAVPTALTVRDFVEQHAETPFSRIPVYEHDRDAVAGFVLKSDLLLAHARGGREAPVREFVRELRTIPSTAPISGALDHLFNLRTHILLVADTFGTTLGIVTLEDVLETLLGLEIIDEADKTTDMQALARAQWEKRARELGILSHPTPERSPPRNPAIDS